MALFKLPCTCYPSAQWPAAARLPAACCWLAGTRTQSRRLGPAPWAAAVDTPRASAGEPDGGAKGEAGAQGKALNTPRQRRLAQQRRKWEEAQQQQLSQPQPAPALQRSRRLAPHAPHAPSAASAPKRVELPQRSAAAAGTAPAAAITAADPAPHAAPSSARPPLLPAAAATAPHARVAPPRASPPPTPPVVRGSASVAATAAATAASPRPPAAAPPPAAPVGPRAPLPAPAPRAARVGAAPPSSYSPSSPHPPAAAPSAPPTPPLAAAAAAWPSVFTPPPGTPLDLASLPGPQLAALARAWADELAEAERRSYGPPSRDVAASTAAAAAAAADGGVLGSSDGGGGRPAGQLSRRGSGSGGGGGGGGAQTLAEAEASVVGRLGALAAAAEAAAEGGALGQQELADLAWAVAHFDRERSLRSLQPRMAVPFRVVPRAMPELELQDFMAEVELRRDVIYLDDGSRAVEESRMTGWQSDIGATFRYSGKEMLPQAGGLTPAVRRVRDALTALTGVQYDSVLINYYEDGKCGMRYHADPLYDRWTPDACVVSLGDTRTFIFRSIADHSSRWQYRVRNGDVVHMYGNCQEVLQHCVRVERHAEDAGPRMSLVFKERLRGPDGRHLLA